MNRELHTFDPDSIRIALARNLPEGLRALADAIESGAVDGRLLNCEGYGFTKWNDTRAHVLATIDLAAPVWEWRGGMRQALPEPPKIALPSREGE